MNEKIFFKNKFEINFRKNILKLKNKLLKLPDKIPPNLWKLLCWGRFKIQKIFSSKNKLLIVKIILEKNKKMIKENINKIIHFTTTLFLVSRGRAVLKNISASVFILSIIILGQLFYPSVTNAATATFNQNNWSGEADTNTIATSTSGWTKYYSKDALMNALSNALNLVTSLTTGSQITNSSGTNSNTYVSGNSVYLCKNVGVACSANQECTSGLCSTTCQLPPCDASTTCGGSCSYGGLTYGTVSANGGCWMDRNLGATAVATAYNSPTTSYGDYYQWGRKTNGHQVSNSGTSGTLFSTYTQDPTSGGLFITSLTSPYDWLTPQNDTLWGSAGGYLNNACPTGWHVPTQSEWSAVVSAEGITNYTTAASSVLHLPTSGYRSYNNAVLDRQGVRAYYWSSDPIATTFADYLYLSSTSALPAINYGIRANGYSVRCLKN